MRRLRLGALTVNRKVPDLGTPLVADIVAVVWMEGWRRREWLIQSRGARERNEDRQSLERRMNREERGGQEEKNRRRRDDFYGGAPVQERPNAHSLGRMSERK